jgi:hypothetical protein
MADRQKKSLNVRPIQDQEAALSLYYTKGYLNKKDTKKIFGEMSDYKFWDLTKPVREAMAEQGIPPAAKGYINAKVAFSVWGIDIEELEQDFKKAVELGLVLC